MVKSHQQLRYVWHLKCKCWPHRYHFNFFFHSKICFRAAWVFLQVLRQQPWTSSFLSLLILCREVLCHQNPIVFLLRNDLLYAAILFEIRKLDQYYFVPQICNQPSIVHRPSETHCLRTRLFTRKSRRESSWPDRGIFDSRVTPWSVALLETKH